MPEDNIASDMPLTPELCEFIGAVIGDGCVSGFLKANGKSNYHISITGDSRLDKNYLTEKMPNTVMKLFGVQAHPSFRTAKNTVVLNIYSKKIFKILTLRFGFIPGRKAFTVTIPKEIMDSKKELLYSTIRGIFDTDDCVYLDKRKAYKVPYARIHIVTHSKFLFEKLASILSQEFALYTHSSQTLWSTRYDIVIYGNEQVELWMSRIGSSNERHLNKLRPVV